MITEEEEEEEEEEGGAGGRGKADAGGIGGDAGYYSDRPGTGTGSESGAGVVGAGVGNGNHVHAILERVFTASSIPPGLDLATPEEEVEEVEEVEVFSPVEEKEGFLETVILEDGEQEEKVGIDKLGQASGSASASLTRHDHHGFAGDGIGEEGQNQSQMGTPLLRYESASPMEREDQEAEADPLHKGMEIGNGDGKEHLGRN